MSFTLKIEEFTSQQVVSLMLDLIKRISHENLIHLTYLAERLTSDEEILSAIKGVRSLLRDPRHPARGLVQRVLSCLLPRGTRALFSTLIYRALLRGSAKRKRFETEHGFRPPFAMILSPTLRCNLRCRGCYTLGYGTKPELPADLVRRILRECEELGIYFVTVLGGEPLIYPDLFSVIREHPHIFFQVYTNGTLLTEEVARQFAALGNAMVVISIEGYEEETDRWRGEGVYGKIVEAFGHLRRAHVPVGASATVTNKNAEVVTSEEFIDRMIEHGSLAQMYFLYIPVNGRADLSLMVTPEQRDHLRRQVSLFRKTKPMFFMDFWNDGPYVGGCIAGGRSYFHINANGDVEPCVYTHVAVDNIATAPLARALDSPLFQAIRQRQPHNANHLRPCMIIDNPRVMRELIAEVKPYFTHPGAEEIYTERWAEMDAYASRYGELAERVWKTEGYGPAPFQISGTARCGAECRPRMRERGRRASGKVEAEAHQSPN